MNIYVGCSGFHYSSWKGKFYPRDLQKKDWLHYYSKVFNTVEMNNTFYNFPSVETLEAWKANTPDDFRFTVKANRFFTHLKKLKTDDIFQERIVMFQDLLNSLGSKLACVLWQLPGNLSKNLDKIRDFGKLLDKKKVHVIEFRHDSWFSDDTFEELEKNGFSYCIISAPNNLPELSRVTSNIAYLRFHGKKTWYNYNYSNSELQHWRDKVIKLPVNELYIYFNNDYEAYAPNNGMTLKEMLVKEVS